MKNIILTIDHILDEVIMKMKDKVLSLFIKPIKFIFNKSPEYAMNGICNELNSHDYFVSYRKFYLLKYTFLYVKIAQYFYTTQFKIMFIEYLVH